MTIKQQGGVFGRNPTFNNVEAEGKLTTLGKFGVGTNTPLYDVDVVSAAPSVVLRDTDAGSGTHWMRSSNNTLIVGADIGNSAANSSIWLQVDAATKLSIGSTGDVTVSTGNLVIGTSGKGIDFSATPGTGTSELFDDYEEGTWTPVVSSTSGTITSYVIYSARYTKIGRVITLSTQFAVTDNGTGAGALFIQGFPFANAVATCGVIYNQSTGYTGSVTVSTSATDGYAANYDATYPVATGQTIQFSLTYSE